MSGADTYTPAEVTALLVTAAEKKVKQAYHITFFKAWMAGWMVTFGAVLVQIIQGGAGTARTNFPSLVTVVSSVFFPVGLIMLFLTGQELVTANFLIIPMGLIRRRVKVWELPVNWIIVFFGNLAGALCTVAFMGHYSGLENTAAMVTYSAGVAVTKTTQHWGPCLLRGIGCNFLVCSAIWLGTGARDTVSKMVALWFPVFAFVMIGFEHVVVNMYYIPIGMINGADVSVGKYVSQSMIPSMIGNIIGAVLLGVPMVLFYDGSTLPLFRKLHPGDSTPSTDTVILHDNVDPGAGTVGDNLPTAHKKA
ncbi:hypothetical protein Q5752_004571 [Cryptotrichosporon argae]